MKVFITLAVICLAVNVLAELELSEEHKSKVKTNFHDCVKQENVSEEDVKKLKKQEFSNLSPSTECLAACFLERFGALKDNKIQEDVSLKLLVTIVGEEKAKEVFDKCKNSQGKERCDTGSQIAKCLENFKAYI